MRLQLAFNITYNPQAINYENSGHTDFKNYTVQELEKKIDQLLTESGRFYSESLKNTTVLKMFWKCSSDIIKGATFKNSTSYKNYEVKNIVKEFHTKYKSPVYHLLINYYRIKFNPDLQFAENTLQALGFKKCQNCINSDDNLDYDYINSLSDNDFWGYLLDQDKKKRLENPTDFYKEEEPDLPF